MVVAGQIRGKSPEEIRKVFVWTIENRLEIVIFSILISKMTSLMKKWNESKKKMNGAKATNSQSISLSHFLWFIFPSLLPGWCNSKYSFNLLPPFESCLLYVTPWLIFIWFIYDSSTYDANQLMTHSVTHLKRSLVVYFLSNSRVFYKGFQIHLPNGLKLSYPRVRL